MTSEKLIAIIVGICIVVLLVVIDVFQFLSMSKIKKEIEDLFRKP